MSTLGNNTPDFAYGALGAYLHAWIPGLRKNDAEQNLTSSTLFRGIFLLFPAVAQRVFAKHGDVYTADNFEEVLRPFFMRVKKHHLKDPGQSPVKLHDHFKDVLETGFTIGQSGRA